MSAEPTRGRALWSAVAVLLLAVAVWSFIEWRSAPPPPPKVEMPGH